jgi:hypothetical protein
MLCLHGATKRREHQTRMWHCSPHMTNGGDLTIRIKPNGIAWRSYLMEIEEVDLDWDVAQGHRPPPPTAPGLLLRSRESRRSRPTCRGLSRGHRAVRQP